MNELPKSWNIEKIGNLCEEVQKVDPSNLDRDYFKYIDIGALEPNSSTLENVTTISSKKAPARARQLLSEGDSIFATVRPYMKKIAYISKDFDGEIASTGFCVLRPITKKLNSKYLFYFLASDELLSQVLPLQRGVSYPAIRDKDLKNAQIPVPQVAEQIKIVELIESDLSRLDAALADLKHAKIKAAQFRRSLLQASLNGFFNNGPRDEISGLPKNWKLKTLADVADWTSGGTPSSKDSTLYGGDIPWIVIGDLTEGVVLETEKKITQEGLDSSSAKKLPAGTVMVAMYGASIGRTGVMGKEMTTNQAIACGIPKDEEILGQYLLYFLQSQKNEFIAAGKGGAQPNISQGVVKSWQIPLPPKDEQMQIINEINSQLEHLVQANRATESLLKESNGLRRSLLQAAFTGHLTKEVLSV
jgi:type I restriction enzyme S subunit